jgi:hypothetical protein
MPKVGKGRKSLTNPGSGGKGQNFIIPFVRTIDSAVFLFSPVQSSNVELKFVCNIVKGRNIVKSNKGVSKKLRLFQTVEKVGLEKVGIHHASWDSVVSRCLPTFDSFGFEFSDLFLPTVDL